MISELKHQPLVEATEASARSVSLTVIQEEPESNALRFSEIQGRYLIEEKKGGNWTEKTKEENLKIFELFLLIEGDLPTDKITRKLMFSHKDKLMRVPPNLNKLPEYKR